MRKRIAVKAVIVSAALATCLVCLGLNIRQENDARQKTEPIEEQKPNAEEVAEAVMVEEPEASIHITETRQVVTVTPIATKAKGKVIADGSEHTGADDDIAVSEKGTATVDSSDAEDAEAEEDQLENDGNGEEANGSAGGDSGSAEANEPEPEPAEAGGPEQQAVELVSLPEESTEVEEPVLAEELPVEETSDNDWTYYGNCRITHYCWCASCNGSAYQDTASGATPSAFYTVASGEDLPFGTEVLIGDSVYAVQDRGVGPGQIDIFVGEDHQLALDMGMYWTDVYIRYPQ